MPLGNKTKNMKSQGNICVLYFIWIGKMQSKHLKRVPQNGHPVLVQAGSGPYHSRSMEKESAFYAQNRLLKSHSNKTNS